jgi:hypothetical protein
VVNEALSRVLLAGQAVIDAGSQQLETLEKAEVYSGLVARLLDGGGGTEGELREVFALHQKVVEVVVAAESRASLSGVRRTAVKAYLATLGRRFEEVVSD